MSPLEDDFLGEGRSQMQRIKSVFIWTPPGLARDISCFGKTVNRLQSYIRLYYRRFFCLRALMEFAKNALISLSCLKHYTDSRFTFLRSDLFCHHTGLSTCATFRHATPFSGYSSSCGHLAHITLLVLPSVRQYRPRRSCHLVGHRNNSHIRWSSLEQ